MSDYKRGAIIGIIKGSMVHKCLQQNSDLCPDHSSGRHQRRNNQHVIITNNARNKFGLTIEQSIHLRGT